MPRWKRSKRNGDNSSTVTYAGTFLTVAILIVSLAVSPVFSTVKNLFSLALINVPTWTVRMWLSIINHPVSLRARLSRLVRCVLGAAAAYRNKCTHREYTARISVRARTYLRDKAWYSDAGVFAIRFAVSYYSCRMNGNSGWAWRCARS